MAKKQIRYQQAIEKNFTAALNGEVLTEKVNERLVENGFTPENTLFGNSTCPDEINRFVTNLSAYWGENFALAGLAGIPFTGKTGFSAYSSHMPDGGNLFLLYASHIGINKAGEVGQISRRNISEETPCCGSAVGAYNALLNGTVPDHTTDYQQGYVIEAVRPRLNEIKDNEDPLARLPHVLYEAIHGGIKSIIPDSFPHNIALLGGIEINTPIGEPAYFLVKNFEIVRPSGAYRLNLIDTL